MYFQQNALMLSDIIKNIHYQSLRCFRLRSIGGQSLKLPRGPNYTIHKKHVSTTFFDALFMVFQGLNCIHNDLCPCHSIAKHYGGTIMLSCIIKIFITNHYGILG